MNELSSRPEVMPPEQLPPPEDLHEVRTLEEQDAFEKELFSEFGWDPQEFRRIQHERYYQEFLTRESEEFAAEKNRYEDRSFLRGLRRLLFGEGPNCYAFAMQWPRNPITGKRFSTRPTPGDLAHKGQSDVHESLWFETPEQLKHTIYKGLRDDAEQCGMSVKEVDRDYKPEKGEWLIAMAATDIRSLPPFGPDYHFYRKGESGVWYHKQGLCEVRDRDESENLIYDPAACDRGMYKAFLGYYAVKDLKGRDE